MNVPFLLFFVFDTVFTGHDWSKPVMTGKIFHD